MPCPSHVAHATSRLPVEVDTMLCPDRAACVANQSCRGRFPLGSRQAGHPHDERAAEGGPSHQYLDAGALWIQDAEEVAPGIRHASLSGA